MSAPTVPLNPYAIGYSGGAIVYWQAPASGPVASYMVTATPGGQSFAVPASLATRQLFRSLTNGTAYTFAIAATNGDGTSPAATTPIMVPPGLPGNLPVVFLQVQAQLAADFAARGQPVPESQFGRQYLPENGSYPRLVMIPESETPGNVTSLGSIPGGPRQIGNRVVRLAWECWGGLPAPTTPAAWQPNTSYTLGTEVLDPSASALNAGRWQCVTAGTSGGNDPFPDNPLYGQTQADNAASWICCGSAAQDARNQYGATEALAQYLWSSLYNLYGGGRLKWLGATWAKADGETTAYGTVVTLRTSLELPLVSDWGLFTQVTGLPLSWQFST